MSDRKLKALSTSKYVKYISVTKNMANMTTISITVTNFYVTAKKTRKYIFVIYKEHKMLKLKHIK